MSSKKQEKRTFEKFPLRKSTAILWLSVGALALSVLGIVLSSVRIYKEGVHSFYDCLKNPFLILVCVFAIVLVTSIFIHCEYRIDEKELVSCYGFVKNRIPLEQISAATSDPENNKIYLTFKEIEGQLVVLTSSEKREDFIRALLKGNPSIDYSFTFREKTEEDK